MVQKICPYCDQVISNSLYCKNCRSRLRPGQARDIDFYLNQRHPGEDPGCLYHIETAETYAGTYAGSPEQSAEKNRQQRRNRTDFGQMRSGEKRRMGKAAAAGPVQIPTQKPKKKQSGTFGGIVTLIVWITLMNALLRSCGNMH